MTAVKFGIISVATICILVATAFVELFVGVSAGVTVLTIIFGLPLLILAIGVVVNADEVQDWFVRTYK